MCPVHAVYWLSGGADSADRRGHSPFFPRVLEHFVSFDFQIAQGFGGLLAFRIGLKQVPHFQRRGPTDLQLTGQLRSRFALHYLSNEQDGLLRSEVSAFKHGATVKIVNASAIPAPIHIQVAPFRLPKPNRLINTSLTMWTFQPIWMKIFLQPLSAGFPIHEFCDWKIHVAYFTQSLVLNMSQNLMVKCFAHTENRFHC